MARLDNEQFSKALFLLMRSTATIFEKLNSRAGPGACASFLLTAITDSTALEGGSILVKSNEVQHISSPWIDGDILQYGRAYAAYKLALQTLHADHISHSHGFVNQAEQQQKAAEPVPGMTACVPVKAVLTGVRSTDLAEARRMVSTACHLTWGTSGMHSRLLD